jgi:hypothetical protein
MSLTKDSSTNISSANVSCADMCRKKFQSSRDPIAQEVRIKRIQVLFPKIALLFANYALSKAETTYSVPVYSHTAYEIVHTNTDVDLNEVLVDDIKVMYKHPKLLGSLETILKLPPYKFTVQNHGPDFLVMKWD